MYQVLMVMGGYECEQPTEMFVVGKDSSWTALDDVKPDNFAFAVTIKNEVYKSGMNLHHFFHIKTNC